MDRQELLQDILSDDEVDRIVYNVVALRAPDPVSEQELEKIVAWAALMRTGHGLLELLMGGQVGVSGLDENEEPCFFLTERKSEAPWHKKKKNRSKYK